jgi:hypothetical protein
MVADYHRTIVARLMSPAKFVRGFNPPVYRAGFPQAHRLARAGADGGNRTHASSLETGARPSSCIRGMQFSIAACLGGTFPRRRAGRSNWG